MIFIDHKLLYYLIIFTLFKDKTLFGALFFLGLPFLKNLSIFQSFFNFNTTLKDSSNQNKNKLKMNLN